MKHWITRAAIVKRGLPVVGIALVGAVAVSVCGNQVGSIVLGCRPFGPWLTRDGSTECGPIVVGKVVKTKTNADGSIGIDSSAGNNMQDNFDIENPAHLTANASSNRLLVIASLVRMCTPHPGLTYGARRFPTYPRSFAGLAAPCFSVFAAHATLWKIRGPACHPRRAPH